MAKLKQKVLVRIRAEALLFVWCDNVANQIADMLSIEGVKSVFTSNSGGFLEVFTDPRYDTNELAVEIEKLLLAEVPEEFGEFDGQKFKD